MGAPMKPYGVSNWPHGRAWPAALRRAPAEEAARVAVVAVDHQRNLAVAAAMAASACPA